MSKEFSRSALVSSALHDECLAYLNDRIKKFPENIRLCEELTDQVGEYYLLCGQIEALGALELITHSEYWELGNKVDELYKELILDD